MIIRRCLGKPRRFSNKFLINERKKLEEFRKIANNYLNDSV